MTPEEFQRIKEAEKQHLRAMKKLKQAVRDLERQKKLTGAVEKITQSEDLLSQHDSLVDQLAIETAHSEARLEVALESAAAQESLRRAEEARAKLDADMQKLRARDLVQQLKTQMGEVDTTPATEEKQPVDESDAPEQSTGDDSVEKTPLPDKTLGRMRKK